MSKIKICGYANVFNIKDYKNDIILPLSFSKNKNIIPILYEHNSNYIIGHTINIYENETGLYVDGILDINNKHLENLIFSDIINGLSIGYEARNFYYENNNRIITNIKLLEVSLVKNPANKHSKITFKKIL